MTILSPDQLDAVRDDLRIIVWALDRMKMHTGFDINLTRDAAGPDDLRYSCRLSDPIDPSVGIYGWSDNGWSAFTEAYSRRKQREAVVEDESFKAEAAAIRQRHEAAAQREIELLRSRPTAS